MNIDLHGLNVEEATAVLMNALFSFSSSFDYKLEIITGKGEGILKMTVLNILDDEGYEYKSEEGRVIVYKSEDEDEDDFNDLFNKIKNNI